MEWSLWASLEDNGEKGSGMLPCPQHFCNRRPKKDAMTRLKDCSVCRQMIKQLVSFSKGSATNSFQYGGSLHFDEKMIGMILDFPKIVSLKNATAALAEESPQQNACAMAFTGFGNLTSNTPFGTAAPARFVFSLTNKQFRFRPSDHIR